MGEEDDSMFLQGRFDAPRIVPSTAFLVLGILVAGDIDRWWIGWCVLIPLLVVLRFLFGIGSTSMYIIGVFGFTWGAWNLHGIQNDDSIIQTGYNTTPKLMNITGRVTDVDPDRSRGSKSVFTSTHLIDREGTYRPFRGCMSWRMEGHHELHDGDRVRLVGWIFPPGGIKSSDPDDVDWITMARLSGYRGRLVVPDQRLVHRLPETSVSGLLSSIRGALRTHCAEIVSQGVTTYRERTLLLGMTIGIRGPLWNHVSAPFRRAGVAHVLAISGMHLGIVIGFAFLVGRVSGVSGPVVGFLIITTTLLYLAVVSWRPPIIRSAIMAITLSLGGCIRRFPISTSLLFLAAMLILLHKPGSLFLPGFQLSFVVVLYILLGTQKVRRRWFRMIETRSGKEPHGALITPLQTTLVVSVVAWLASVPIILHHFGTISPFTVPLSIVLIPFMTMILGLSCLKITLSVIGWEDLISPELVAFPTQCVIMIVDWFDSLPMSCVTIDKPSWIIVPLGLLAVYLWIMIGLRESCWRIRQLITNRFGRSGRTERDPASRY